MKNYDRKKTPTKSTTRRRRRSTRKLANVLSILLVVTSVLYLGLRVGCARFAYPITPSIEDTVLEDCGDYKEFQPKYTYEELVIVANTLEGEAGGLSREEMRLVAWCICNRVDTGLWGDTIADVVTTDQFCAYDPERLLGSKISGWPGQLSRREVSQMLLEVSKEVLDEWSVGNEADILEPYATTADYLYFYGDGKHNWYREVY